MFNMMQYFGNPSRHFKKTKPRVLRTDILGEVGTLVGFKNVNGSHVRKKN